MLETIVANLFGRVRRERVGDKEYIVVPLTMLVPGVLNGNQGPLLYPASEVEASTPLWEGTIITDGHIGGANGRRLQTQQQFSIGVIQKPVFNNGRLQAEAWFDVQKTRRINPQILAALNAGQKIEVSTGLRTTDEHVSGVHNDGRPYTRIARDYQPDHLAILVNERGACSIQDGCGILNCDQTPHQPAGGILGHPEIDWGSSQLPTMQRVVPNVTLRGGPQGGALGHTEIIWDQSPQQHQQQPQQYQQPTVSEGRYGPAGGSLGHLTPTWD